MGRGRGQAGKRDIAVGTVYGWLERDRAAGAEELTGVLAPLRDTEFFRQVFIDRGAVAWPGEIDLAPDAMYADVASERRDSQADHPAIYR